MRIVEFINQNGQITNRDIRSLFNISNRAALDEVMKLLTIKAIKKAGKGRSLRYEIS